MIFYFHAIRQVDIIISLGIVQLMRDMDKDIKFELLITHYPKLYKYDQLKLDEYFDRVHHLPYCNYEKNIVKGLKQAVKHYQEVNKIEIDKEAVFFFYDDSELACLNLYRYIDKLRKKNYRIKSYHLVYQLNPLKYQLLDNIKISFWRTLAFSFYAYLFYGRMLWYQYVPGSIKIGNRLLGIDMFAKEVFFNRTSPGGYKSEFEEMSLTLDQIKFSDKEQVLSLPDDAILFIGHNLKTYIPDRAQFAFLMNQVLDKIRETYQGHKLFIKWHPHDTNEDYQDVRLPDFKIIDQKEYLEKIIIFNAGKIKAVFSFFSSANFCSAALGIPSYYLYPLIKLKHQNSDYLNALLIDPEQNSHIAKITKLEEIALMNKENMDRSFNTAKEKWARLLRQIKQ